MTGDGFESLRDYGASEGPSVLNTTGKTIHYDSTILKLDLAGVQCLTDSLDPNETLVEYPDWNTDSAPPDVPTGLRVVNGEWTYDPDEHVTLFFAWDASPNAVSYILYGDGTQRAMSLVASVTLTGLPIDTTILFTVSAVSLRGHESAQSPALSVFTDD